MAAAPRQSSPPLPPWTWFLALVRLGLAAVIWWVLTGGALSSWLVGAPAVLLATAASLRWSGTTQFPVRLLPAVRFTLFFLSRSLSAGIDVARRTLTRTPQLDPELMTFPLRLPPGPPRWLLMSAMSLLPGSLSVALEEEQLLLHSLDRALPLADELRDVEARVAAIFGLHLDPLPGPSR